MTAVSLTVPYPPLEIACFGDAMPSSLLECFWQVLLSFCNKQCGVWLEAFVSVAVTCAEGGFGPPSEATLNQPPDCSRDPKQVGKACHTHIYQPQTLNPRNQAQVILTLTTNSPKTRPKPTLHPELSNRTPKLKSILNSPTPPKPWFQSTSSKNMFLYGGRVSECHGTRSLLGFQP